MQETGDSPKQPRATSAKEAARAARIRNASNRMAFITGQIQDLPPPAPVVPTPTPEPSPQFPSSSPKLTTTPTTPKRGYIHIISYTLSLLVATLLTANTLGRYPQGEGHDRRALAYMYLGTLLVAILVLSKRLWTTVWQVSLAAFFWLIFVELQFIVLKNQRIADSNLMWISGISFFFEFVVARILSNSILKGLLAMVQGPVVGMVQYFARLALILVFMILFPALVTSVAELPTWMNFGGGGVFVWACLSMFVGSRFSTKLL